MPPPQKKKKEGGRNGAYDYIPLTQQTITSTKFLREDYTTRFSNFILYYNFLTNSLKLIKVYIIRRDFTRNIMAMLIFHQKSLFLRKSQKTRFLALIFRNRLEKNQNSKRCFQNIKLTKNIHLNVAFSHFSKFLLIFLVKCQIRQKFHFFTIFFSFLTLFGMKLTKSAKTWKNEKT